jgi:Matrixin
MKQKILGLALGVALLLLIVAASAGMLLPLSDTGKEHSQAPEHSPVIDADFNLERIDFIHYAKPPGGSKPAPTSTCYKLLHLKWTTLPVSCTINPSTQEGLDSQFVEDKIITAAETWDEATSKELFRDFSVDSSVTYGLDGVNAIAFGLDDDPNVIAITSIWFYRTTGQIVETDMLFNEKWVWGTAESGGTQMDVQNIATHEFGHVAGLGDLYTTSCQEVTMFGYSGYEETKKRSLEPADVTGIRKIYG